MTQDNPGHEKREANQTDTPTEGKATHPQAEIAPTSIELHPHSAADHHPSTDEEKKERRERLKLVFEGIGLLVLTLYTIFSAFQWRTMSGQLDEMRKVTGATERSINQADLNFRRDERAWIGFALPEGIQIQKEATTQRPTALLVPTQTVNTGKTPAKKVTGNLAITVIKKGEKLVFEYTSGHTNYGIYGGTMFPGGRVTLAQPAIRHGPKKAITIVPTDALMQEINQGQSFVVVYGRVTYCDIFGVSHWTTFCRYATRPGFIDYACMNYNDADINETPDKSGCPAK